MGLYLECLVKTCDVVYSGCSVFYKVTIVCKLSLHYCFVYIAYLNYMIYIITDMYMYLTEMYEHNLNKKE